MGNSSSTAPLPTDSMRPARLRNPLVGQVRWLAWLTAVCGGLAVVALPLGTSQLGEPDASPPIFASFVGGVIALSMALVCGIAWACTAFYLRRYDADLVQFEQGHALVHWTYSADEWDRFMDAETNEASRIAGYAAGLFTVIGVLIGAIAGFNGAAIAGSAILTVLAAAICGGLVGLGCGAIAQTLAMRRCRRWRRAVGETFIGERGLYFAGDYRPWSLLGQQLSAVTLNADRDPQVLSFRYRMQTNNGSTTQDVNVPVPSGQDKLAAALAARLDAL